jgi:hypothetical protein
MKRVLPVLLFLLVCLTLSAQMWNGRDTLYGNEWIRYDQPYYKIPVAADGVYRIPYETLAAAGIAAADLAPGRYQLFHLGEERPLHVSTAAPLVPGDYLEFYGEQNRAQLDRFLFQDPEREMLNPRYSMFTDTSVYFLTVGEAGTAGLRYQEVVNDLTDVPAKEGWFWGETGQVYSNGQVQETFEEGAAYSHFDSGEGFALSYRKTHNLDLVPAHRAPVNETARFMIRMVARPRNNHQLRISVNNQALYDTTYNGFRMQALNLTKNAAALTDKEQVSIAGLGEGNDHYAIAQILLTYPRAFNFENKPFFLFDLSGSPVSKYLEIERFQTGGIAPVLYDLSSGIRIVARNEGNLVKIHLPARMQDRRLVLVNPQTGVKAVAGLQPVTFTDFSEVDAEYTIISSQKLFDDGQGRNLVAEYAAYRGSAEGGGYRTEVVEIQQLYDQFAYGIQRHPLSIRNFAHFVRRSRPSARYFLLIGKAREYDQIRRGNQLSSEKNQTFHLPTFGKPGADNLLFATNQSQAPVLPFGRIAASTAEDLRWYFEKVKEQEAVARSTREADRAWRKEIIHLGGGGGAAEQQIIRNALARMESTIEANRYGGNVFSFFKTSSEPIQQAQSEQITGRINSGAGIITFFGHSGTGGFDFSLDDPSTYLNQGRYPLLFSLGCLSGHIHLDFKSVGEHFVFQQQRGAIAFIATVGFGTIGTLESLTGEFYRLAGSDLYGQGIGDILQNALKRFDGSSSFFMRTLLQQFTLNGDPAVVLTPFEGPDYVVRAEAVRFDPEVVNAQQERFKIAFAVSNLGKNTPDSLVLRIRRRLPDGSELTVLQDTIAGPAYRRELEYEVATLGKRAVGENRFFIELDPGGLVREFPLPAAKENNELLAPDGSKGMSFYIFDNTVLPLFPEEFGIVAQTPVELIAAPTGAFAPEQTYRFELDTTEYFNSSLKISREIRQSGGVIRWPVDLALENGRTYYWRVSLEDGSGSEHLWTGSSFTYLPGSPPGWNQSHFFQFRKNQFQDMEARESDRRVRYIDDIKTLRVVNGVYPDVWPGISINNDPYGYLPWDNPIRGGVYITVLDSLTANPWINIPPGDYGSHVSPWAYWAAYPYRTQDKENRTKAINFLENVVPSGSYVLVYTVQHQTVDYEPSEWAADSTELGTNLFQVLERQGARLIRGTATSGARPYVIFYKKDDPSYPVFERVVERGESIEEVFSIPGRWDSGTMKSVNIGPASRWTAFSRSLSELEELDEYSFDLYGIRPDSTQVLLTEGLSAADTTLAWIDAGEFPMLKVHYASSDTARRSAPRLDFWRVLYEGLPDAMLNPLAHYRPPPDSLQQGQPLLLEVAVSNITNFDMDSLLVRYRLLDEQNRATVINRRYRSLPGGDTLIAVLRLDTWQLSGKYQLIVEVNPDRDQPERYHSNNIGILEFRIVGDRQNPLLDVTFDGRHIMSGDIISPKPFITISLEDENKFFALNDTSLVNVLVKYPNRSEGDAGAFQQRGTAILPATDLSEGKANRARIEWRPQFTESGAYQLTVQARDAAGNQSGAYDYRVDFTVVMESSLSNVFNYPNPFSTSTRFVYTLTGAEPPPVFSIQIMTISGRIVRELTQDELGPLRTGTHQTEFAWDGTDEYGDRLANGVYLYRVVAKDDQGTDFEKWENGTDRFFKKGIGKLVILR